MLLQAEKSARTRLLVYCEDDRGLREEELRKCARDPIYWLNTWVWFNDPHSDDPDFRRMPLVLWPEQDRYVRFLLSGVELGEDRLANKSRKIGATWLAIALCVHQFVFVKGFSARVGHRKEAEAASASVDSLTGKVRYILENLPHWMRPDCVLGNTLIINKENGSEIKGESCNQNFARGARPRIILQDEAAHIEPNIQNLIQAATESAATSQWRISTPNGRGNRFYTDCESASPSKKISINWKADPRRTESWYKSLLRENGGTKSYDEREQEYNCNFSAVTGTRVWHWSDERLVNEADLYDLVQVRDRGLGNKSPLLSRGSFYPIGAMDFGSGPSLTVYVELLAFYDTNNRLEHIVVPYSEYWEGEGSSRIGTRIRANQKAEYGTTFTVWGDPAGKQRQSDQQTWIKDLRGSGVKAKALPDWYNTKDGQQTIVRRVQEGIEGEKGWSLLIHDRNHQLIEDIEQWQYSLPPGMLPENANMAQIKPRKDGPSHACQALAYGVGRIVKSHSRKPRVMGAGLSIIRNPIG